MKTIIKELFGFIANDRTVYEFTPGYRTIIEPEEISFDQWCQEFRVSMMYGKETRHFN